MAKNRQPGFSHGPIAPMTSPRPVTGKATPLVVRPAVPSKPSPNDSKPSDPPASGLGFGDSGKPASGHVGGTQTHLPTKFSG